MSRPSNVWIEPVLRMATVADNGRSRYHPGMCDDASVSRRSLCLAALAIPLLPRVACAAEYSSIREFAGQAATMREKAIAAGDQPYGAVIVLDGCIVGYGPSRVIVDNNLDAHAERVALWDAMSRLDRKLLTGAVIYSTSTPCMICQRALSSAGIARMYVGPQAADEGPPRMG
jgi:tRNA(Arg) A34 adenosine deaminase TadA